MRARRTGQLNHRRRPRTPEKWQAAAAICEGTPASHHLDAGGESIACTHVEDHARGPGHYPASINGARASAAHSPAVQAGWGEQIVLATPAFSAPQARHRIHRDQRRIAFCDLSLRALRAQPSRFTSVYVRKKSLNHDII